MKCEIQWIDKESKLPTPDRHEAVCIAWLRMTYHDGVIEDKKYLCCASHQLILRTLHKEVIHDDWGNVLFTSEWREEPLNDYSDCEVAP